MYFDAMVVFVTSQTLLFRLALAMLCCAILSSLKIMIIFNKTSAYVLLKMIIILSKLRIVQHNLERKWIRNSNINIIQKMKDMFSPSKKGSILKEFLSCKKSWIWRFCKANFLKKTMLMFAIGAKSTMQNIDYLQMVSA